jgi:hypothetical protein
MTITERQPGSFAIAERWSNAKAVRIVALALAGRSSVQIAEALRDGTTPGSIRSMLSKWNVQSTGEPFCKVPLKTRTRAHLGWRAERRGLTPEEYAAQVIEAVVADDLFDAVTRTLRLKR